MALVIVCVLGGIALAITATTFIGLLATWTARPGPRHRGCGHPRVITSSDAEDRCWACCHARISHALLLPAHLVRHGH
ncbi:MAG TPA: hypothetical protein VFT62_11410 [Mycobacteriales bacterium]|nr:hypothetical protein [Mycobacteriales bacterium]